VAEFDQKWFRSWHGAPTDPKWLVVARKAQVAPGVVSAVFWALMDYASQHTDRGSVEGFDTETYAAFSGWEESEIMAILTAMINKGIITPDNRLAAWDKRQPKKEDTTAAERQQRKRERDRLAERDNSVTNAPQPPVSQNVTLCHAMSHEVTIDKIRGDKIREEEEDTSARSQMTRQYEAVLGMVPMASYSEMIGYMDKLLNASSADWWLLALRETSQAKRPGWQYMKAVLEAWLAAGQPSTNTANDKANGHETNSRLSVPAPSRDEQAEADARQAAYERRTVEELARAGRLL